MHHIVRHLLLLALYAALAANASAKPTLTFSCLNPKMGLQFKQVAATRASSQPVQFQINWDGQLPSGAINVDSRNNGVCTVEVSEGYVLKSGRGSFSATGSYNASDPRRPKDIDQIVRVTFEPQVNTGEFTIKATSGSPKGSVTIVFVIDYEKDE